MQKPSDTDVFRTPEGIFRISGKKTPPLQDVAAEVFFRGSLRCRAADQAAVAFSSFFMIEKMKSAESRQRTISTLQTIQRAIPLPQRYPMSEVA